MTPHVKNTFFLLKKFLFNNGVPFQVGPSRSSQAPSFHYISGPATAVLPTPHAGSFATLSTHPAYKYAAELRNSAKLPANLGWFPMEKG